MNVVPRPDFEASGFGVDQCGGMGAKSVEFDKFQTPIDSGCYRLAHRSAPVDSLYKVDAPTAYGTHGVLKPQVHEASDASAYMPAWDNYSFN